MLSQSSIFLAILLSLINFTSSEFIPSSQNLNPLKLYGYNQIRYDEFTTLKDLTDKFFTFNVNDKSLANTNLFVGVAGEECKDLLISPAFRASQRHGGSAVQSVSLPKSEFPLKFDNCAEVIALIYINIYFNFIIITFNLFNLGFLLSKTQRNYVPSIK